MSLKDIGRKERFHELDGVVSLRRWGGRRRDTGGSSHAPDGAQEAEVRGLADQGHATLSTERVEFPPSYRGTRP